MKKLLIEFSISIVLILSLSILFGIFWVSFFLFTPQEITELQKVPYILQGNTDYGGSNIFAFFVSCHLFIGLIACFHWTYYFSTFEPKNTLCKLLKSKTCILSYWILFFVINYNVFLPFDIYKDLPYGSKDRIYFFCEYFQVLILIVTFYLLSTIFIFLLSKVKLPITSKYILSPLFIFILINIGWTGITPKAGRILLSGEIPKYSPNSKTHEIILEIQKYCSFYHRNNEN